MAGILLLASAAGVFSLSQKIHREIRSSSENSLREMLFVTTQHTNQMFLRDDQIASLAFVPRGGDQGITNSGKPFDPAQFEFSRGRHVSGADMSEPYMGSVGAWCYCLKTEIDGPGGPWARCTGSLSTTTSAA